MNIKPLISITLLSLIALPCFGQAFDRSTSERIASISNSTSRESCVGSSSRTEKILGWAESNTITCSPSNGYCDDSFDCCTLACTDNRCL